ncbi:MAG: hypothetical protein H0X64_15870 [Gemmatimonadaceae bacterium]|nr:hypothetical protein [Gemmatimonadaceae bacterium]
MRPEPIDDAVRAMDESLEPLCDRCQASFRVARSSLCAACWYDEIESRLD